MGTEYRVIGRSVSRVLARARESSFYQQVSGIRTSFGPALCSKEAREPAPLEFNLTVGPCRFGETIVYN